MVGQSSLSESSLSGSSSVSKGRIVEQIVGRMLSTSGINAWGQFTCDAAKELVVLGLHCMSLLSSLMSVDAKEHTKEAFLEALWNKIRRTIENALN